MPRFLKERITELLGAATGMLATDPKRRSSGYNAALHDVLEVLKPLELAVLFEKPVEDDPEISAITYLILPDVYLELQDLLRISMRHAGYELGRTAPLLDAVLAGLLGRLPVRAKALACAHLTPEHVRDLIERVGEYGLESAVPYREGEPTRPITLVSPIELGQEGAPEGEASCRDS